MIADAPNTIGTFQMVRGQVLFLLAQYMHIRNMSAISTQTAPGINSHLAQVEGKVTGTHVSANRKWTRPLAQRARSTESEFNRHENEAGDLPKAQPSGCGGGTVAKKN